MPAPSPTTEPVINGVVSLVLSAKLIIISGAVKSISPTSLAEAVLPAASVTIATTLNCPSTNSLLASIDQAPFASVTT